jgi:kumamolisin
MTNSPDDERMGAAVPDDYRRLSGSERRAGLHSTRLGPADPDAAMSITIVLRRRPDGPPMPDFDYWQRTHPMERRYLSVEECGQFYGSSAEDLDAVTSFVTAAGMKVEEAHGARRTVTASGTVAQVNRAFAIEMQRYDSPLPKAGRAGFGGQRAKETQPKRQIHRAYEGHAHIPQALAPIIVAVFGLNDAQVGTRNIDPVDTVPLTVPEVCNLYGWPVNPVPGQILGIIAFGLYPNDIALYFENLNKSIYNAGFYVQGNQPTNSEVPGLAQGGVAEPPPADAVAGSFIAPSQAAGTLVFASGTNEPGNDGVETPIDICIASTIAQGATIMLYFCDLTATGFHSALTNAIMPNGGQVQPSVLSISYCFLPAGDDAAGFSAAMITPMEVAAVSELFQISTVTGVTVCVASGDNGVGNGIVDGDDGKCHVTYPASDPWVLACGATTIGNIDPRHLHRSGLRFEEYLWSDWLGVTGGGVSAFFNNKTGNAAYPAFLQPSYQAEANIPTSLNDGSVGRGVPDIAANGGPSGYYFYILNGDWTGAGGTSIAAPLIAGLLTQVNAALGQRIGFFNPTLYANAATLCRKITSTPAANAIGNSVLVPGTAVSGQSPIVETQGYPGTTAGWDACTGWGVLIWDGLMDVLRKPKAFIADHPKLIADHPKSISEYLPNLPWLAPTWSLVLTEQLDRIEGKVGELSEEARELRAFIRPEERPAMGEPSRPVSATSSEAALPDKMSTLEDEV